MRAKRNRFNHNLLAENLIQEGKPLFKSIKGKWNSAYFQNKNPITLELACGYGEYTTGLATIYPLRNFVGIDIKGDRLWQGSNLAIRERLTNVAFLRILIHDLTDFFEINEVAEIWLIFPDPRPKTRDERRRLTSKRFLDMYKGIISTNGWVKLKTDDAALFEYTLIQLKKREDIIDLKHTWDLSSSSLSTEHHGITTRYEKMFSTQGESIKYLKFRFTE